MSSSGSSKYGERLVNVLGREEAHNEGELAAIKELEAIIQRDKPPPYIEYLMYALLFSRLGKGEQYVKPFVMKALRKVGIVVREGRWPATITTKEDAEAKVGGLVPFGEALANMRMYEASNMIYYRVLDIQEKFFPDKVFMAFNSLGDNFTRLENFDEALRNYKDALNALSAVPGHSLRAKGRLLTKIADKYILLGRIGNANEAANVATLHYTEHPSIVNNTSKGLLRNTRRRIRKGRHRKSNTESMTGVASKRSRRNSRM
jgi:tetratricopeptide (TPR) repeat protein